MLPATSSQPRTEFVLSLTTEPQFLRRLALLWASWFGAGYFPVAPGTAGSVAAMPLAWLAAQLPFSGQACLAIAVTALAIPAAASAGRSFGVVDAKQIVVDEVAGILVTMLGVPFTWKTAIAGFLLFRAFDILKPWPASFFDQRVKNGAGVVLDDICAGIYARLGLATFAWLLPATFA